MLLQLNRPSILVTASVAVLVASQAQALAAPGTVKAAHYDAGRKAIVVPYTGTFPTYFTDSLAGPPRVYFDFDARAGFVGVPTGKASGHPTLEGWAMAARGPNKTRITLTFDKATRVIVLNDKARSQILLIPDVPGAATSVVPPKPKATPKPKPTPKPTATPKTRTFHQTVGETDFRYTVGPRPAGATQDQVHVDVGTSGVTDFHVTSEPERDYVSFSISIQGKQPGVPMASPGPLVTPKPLPTPAVLATPQPLPTPMPEVSAEPLPLPSEEPTPVPTPEAEPSPVVIEAPAARPGTSLAIYGDYNLGLDEASPTFASQFSSTDTSAQGAYLFTRFGGNWGYLLDARHLSYRITDQQTQNATAHVRDEYELNTGFGLRFEPFGAEQMVGLGVFTRYLSNNNIVATDDTPIGPPATPGILSAPSNVFIGPSLFAKLELPLFGPLGIQARGGVAPYMIGMMSVPAESLSGMMGYWAVPSLYLRFGGFELAGGYALHSYTASGYDYTRSGPEGRLEMRF